MESAQQNVRIRDYDEAMNYVNSALDRSPEYTEAWMLKADLHMMKGQGDQGIEAYRKAVETGGPDAIFFRWGRAALEFGYYSVADSVLQLYLDSDQVSERYKGEARNLQQRAAYAAQLMQQPVEFTPVWLGPEVNRFEMQYFPSISADGSKLVFTVRDLNSNAEDEDFYISRRSDSAWTSSGKLEGYLNTTGNEGAQSLSADGTVIFFAGCNRPDGFGSCDIYVSFLRNDDTWSEPVNLGDSVNSRFWDTQPSISADGKTLMFIRGGNSMTENTDVYYSNFVNGHWTEARKLPGEVNTPLRETSPFQHFDGRTLYFSSNGHLGMGDDDLFVARKNPDGTWGQVENLGYPINTYEKEFALIVGPDGRTAYYASDRDREADHLNLYTFQLPIESRAVPIAWISGVVTDKETGRPLVARLEFVDLKTGETMHSDRSDRNGRFNVSLPAHANYGLNVTAQGYLFYSENFELTNQDEASAEVLNVALQPIKAGEAVVLRNVFFDTDSYQLKPESIVELDRLVNFLKDNPTVKLSIDGHTDNEGSSAHNRELSLNRANSVVRYLVENEISENRLTPHGYGDTRPIADNNTPEGRAINRRTEVTVVEM